MRWDAPEEVRASRQQTTCKGIFAAARSGCSHKHFSHKIDAVILFMGT